MKISVFTVSSFIQRASRGGPIDTSKIIKAFGVQTPKQRKKFDDIVTHLAGQNMIVRDGSCVQSMMAKVEADKAEAVRGNAA